MLAKATHRKQKKFIISDLKTGFDLSPFHRPKVSQPANPIAKQFTRIAIIGWIARLAIVAGLTMTFFSIFLAGPQATHHNNYMIYNYEVTYAKQHHMTHALKTSLRTAPRTPWYLKFGHIHSNAEYRKMIGAVHQ